MKVLGLDLSLTATGIAGDFGHVTLNTPASRISGMPRYAQIYSTIETYLQSSPRSRASWLVLLEGYSFGSKGDALFQIGELGGIVKYLLWRDHRKALVVPIPPTVVKKWALGRGGGKGTDKQAMRVAAFKRAKMEFDDDNACDAWWLYSMGKHVIGESIVELPKPHLEALKGVEWPEVLAA